MIEKTFAQAKNNAESAARKLLGNISFPPKHAIDIAEDQGLEVVFFDNSEETAKNISGLCDFEGKRIFVNADDKLTRQTFTIAHELGHWVLHKNIYEQHPEKYKLLPRYRDADENDILEVEANFFAGELLVPEALLLKVKTAPLTELADVFGVSLSMIERRLRYVGK